jgi:alcohol dehydrogenase
MAQALVLERPGELRRIALARPEVGDDDGILRVEACGLCGTDHEQYSGHIAAPYRFVPGHEVVGVVEDAGAAALARWGVAIGDRVAVEVFMSCGRCPACLAGECRHCAQHGLRDMYGFIDVDKAPGLWGGYATHLYLAPDALLLPVPPALDPVVATAFNPLGAGLRWAVELPGTQVGAVVAVLGPGIRGLASCAAAKAAGAAFVMVTGVGPSDTDRLALAAAFGADLAVDVNERDPVRALVDATGRLADVVVDVTAKAPAAPAQAVRLARPSGTVVLAGTRGEPSAPGFDPDLIVYKELRILGALGVDRHAYTAALELLATSTLPFADLPRVVAGFDELPALLDRLTGEGDAPRPVHAVFVPQAGSATPSYM